MIPDLSWMDDGVCRELDPDVFFSDGSSRPAFERQLINACCRTCPVINECAEYALSQTEPVFGVWGGMSERQISVARKARGKQVGGAADSWLYPDPRGKGNADVA